MVQQVFPYLKSFGQGILAVSCLIFVATTPFSQAADHTDGPRVKQSANKVADLTDVYIFREGDQSGNIADNANVTLALGVNPLTMPGEKPTFASDVAYEFKVAPGKDFANAKLLTFRFGAPAADGTQEIYVNGNLVDKKTTTGTSSPQEGKVDLKGHTTKVFAGLREDPFFFDLRVVQEGLGTGKSDPKDTFAGTNVLAIVTSVPVAYFQTASKETTFSVWATTSK